MKTRIKIKSSKNLLQEAPPGTKEAGKWIGKRGLKWLGLLGWLVAEYQIEKNQPDLYQSWATYTDPRRPVTWFLRYAGISHWPGFSHITGDVEPTAERYVTSAEGGGPWDLIPQGYPNPWAADPEVEKQVRKAGTKTVEILEKLEGTTDDKDPQRRERLTDELKRSIEDGVALVDRLKKKYGANISMQVAECLMPPPWAVGSGFGLNNPFFMSIEEPTSTATKNMQAMYDGMMRSLEKNARKNISFNPTTCVKLRLMLYGTPPEGAKSGSGRGGK